MKFVLPSAVSSLARWLLVPIAAAFLSACGSDDHPVPAKDVVQTAADNGSFATLTAAIKAANLETTLKGPGPFTVFAPNDAAFAKIPKAQLDALIANPAELAKVLTYHVVPGKVLKADVKPGLVKTVQGQDVLLSADGANLKINGVNIIATDVIASNGVIHVIDTVLTVPTNIVGVASASASPTFKTLLAAATNAGLADTLSTGGPFTVFAPTDEAFTALLGELGLTADALLANTTLLKAVLQYHVVSGKVLKAQIPLGKTITPLASGVFKIDTAGTDVVVTDGRNRSSKIIATDLLASNGIIHVIDKVLLPADKDIVQTASANSSFSTLVAAVQAAGLVDTLKGAGPFTVFAPTNAAFDALLAELGVTLDQLVANKTLLTSVLTYHVVPGRVLKAEVPAGQPIATVQKETFTVNGPSDKLVITDQRGRTANITATDIFASNGVIHVIDRVILPKP